MELLSMIYPHHCLACNDIFYETEELICKKCKITLPVTGFEDEPNNPLELIFKGRVKIQEATSMFYFTKKKRVQNLIHQLKYNKRQDVGKVLGNYLGLSLKHSDRFNTIDYVVPIPLHKNKLKRRGFNQSLVIAEGIVEEIQNAQVKNLLKRDIDTKTQTRKSKLKRWENVDGIFSLSEDIKDKNILIVDDVVTTGSTLEAAVEAFSNQKGINISLATIAFADK